jgi:hypothetical protein
MFKPVLSLFLTTLLIICAGAQPAHAKSTAEKQARFTEKVKTGILKLGVGEQARVELKLIDKSKLKGYIQEAGADSFATIKNARHPE